MSAICPTCNSKLSCGCQLTSASDGARICTLCKARYEAELLAKKNTGSTITLNQPNSVIPVFKPY